MTVALPAVHRQQGIVALRALVVEEVADRDHHVVDRTGVVQLAFPRLHAARLSRSGEAEAIAIASPRLPGKSDNGGKINPEAESRA